MFQSTKGVSWRHHAHPSDGEARDLAFGARNGTVEAGMDDSCDQGI